MGSNQNLQWVILHENLYQKNLWKNYWKGDVVLTGCITRRPVACVGGGP